MKRRFADKDFLAGWLLLTLGLLGLWVGSGYHAGTAARMGAGYFPMLVSTALCLFGFLTIVKGCVSPGPGTSDWAVRPLLVILGSVILFGLVLASLGLPLATAMLVFLAGLASVESRRGELLLLSASLAVMSVVLFVLLLGMPFSLWPG